MASNERDSQFSEWASLLFEEINEDFRSLNIYYDDGDEQEVDKARKGIETSIARRVYDLAMFIVSQAYADELKPKEILHKNGKPVLMYPENLAEWYKEKSQCQN